MGAASSDLIVDSRQVDLEEAIRRAPLTAEAMRQHLIARCDSTGGQAALARELNVAQSLISNAINRRPSFSPALANGLGFVEVAAYVRVRG